MQAIDDEMVEEEISKLLADPDVNLAKLEQKVRYRRRRYLYKLRNLKKQGEELRSAGITEEILLSGADDLED